jgi:4-amino-4-deoxy-L-arabinose transferase-like glycosyltransferase
VADPEHEAEYAAAQSPPANPPEPASSWNEQHGSERGAALCVTVIFLVACLLLINSLTVYQGDERYYTDAAIRMLQSGDYLTPYFDDGEPRFLKPILSYWPLAASFRLFGINLPASRIPSIIAGCLVVWLTYQLAQVLFRHNGIAALAAAILASNGNFLHASLRARPDIHLCLFVTVSLYGFARLLFRDGSAYSYACAYLGSGLAVATKGLPGLLPVVFASLFCLLRRSSDCKLPRLIHLPSIVAGVAVGLCWFILMYVLHGATAIQAFYSDQIQDKLAGSAINVFHNGFKYLTSMAAIFSPWFVIVVVLLLMRFDNAATHPLKRFRSECLFSLGWFMTIMVVYLGGMTNRNRYMLPAFPLLACFIAVMLEPCLRGGLPGRLLYKILPGWLSVLGLIWGALLVGMGRRLHSDLMVGGVICVLAANGLFVMTRRSRPSTRVVAIAGFLLVFFTGHELFTRSVFAVSPVSAWLETIQRERIDLQRTVIGALGIRPNFIGQARILSNGRLHFRQLPEDAVSLQAREYPVLIASETFSRQLSAADYTLIRSGFVYDDITLKDIPHLLRSQDCQLHLSSLQIPFHVAVRKPLR